MTYNLGYHSFGGIRMLFGAILMASLTACGSSITVNTDGDGNVVGYVNEQQAINCGINCSHNDQSPFGIVLNANPRNDAAFIEWQGDGNISGICGSNPICSLSIPPNQHYNVEAVFSDSNNPGFASCRAYLADGIRSFYINTEKDVYFDAMRAFLCKTDWNLASNTQLKGEVGGIFEALFGDVGDVDIDNQIAIWTEAQCTIDSGIDYSLEDTFELKYAADLELLQLYEECLHQSQNPASLDCSITQSQNSDVFSYKIKPTGEGLTLTNFRYETVNATKISSIDFPDFLTAYDNAHAGTFDMIFNMDDIYKGALVTVHADSESFGNFSCTQHVDGAMLPTYELGGSISGLSGSLTLDDGNGNQLEISSNGLFKFNSKYIENESFNVNLVDKPDFQECSVSKGSGTFSNQTIDHVKVVCTSSFADIISASNGNLFLKAGNGDGFSENVYPVSNQWGDSGYTWAADFNGDGHLDIASANHAAVYMKFNQGDSFTSQTWGVSGHWGAARYTWVADFDGNGLPDIASASHGTVYMYLNTGNSFKSTSWAVSNQWGAGRYTWVADFNGDGRPDIASADHGNIYLKLNTGNGFNSTTWGVSNQWGAAAYTWVHDFDGNGYPDIASASGDRIYMKYNNGSSFNSTFRPVTNQWGRGDYTWIADFNDDGRPDIASASGSNVYLKLNTGSGFESTTWGVSSQWGAARYTWVADFNGDGKPDIASADYGNVYLKINNGDSFNSETWHVSSQWGGSGYTFIGEFKQ